MYDLSTFSSNVSYLTYKIVHNYNANTFHDECLEDIRINLFTSTIMYSIITYKYEHNNKKHGMRFLNTKIRT